jgi:hypothetical protein
MTNLTIVVKVVDLDIGRIYNHNHVVGMEKISFSDMKAGGKQKRICQSSTSRKENGTATRLAWISKTKLCF